MNMQIIKAGETFWSF